MISAWARCLQGWQKVILITCLALLTGILLVSTIFGDPTKKLVAPNKAEDQRIFDTGIVKIT